MVFPQGKWDLRPALPAYRLRYERGIPNAGSEFKQPHAGLIFTLRLALLPRLSDPRDQR